MRKRRETLDELLNLLLANLETVVPRKKRAKAKKRKVKR